MDYAAKSKKQSFKLNDFEVNLLLNDTQLVIKAEHTITLKQFEATITPEHVKETTSHFFPDLEFLYLGLLDAFEGKDPTVTLVLSDDAQLTYSWERVIRERKMVEKFSIALIEEVMDSSKRTERQMERLLKKSEEQEVRIEALEKENKQLTKEVAIMKEQIEKLLGKKEERLALTFDPSCANAHFFSFSNENKTIGFKSQEWKPVLANVVLPKLQKTTFSVRADSITNGNMMVGICSKTLKDKINIYSYSEAYCYIGNLTGAFITSNKRTNLNNCLLTNGDVITVTVDLSNNTISFEHNSKFIHSINIAPSLEYYPYVELQIQNDKVTLL